MFFINSNTFLNIFYALHYLNLRHDVKIQLNVVQICKHNLFLIIIILLDMES